MAIESHRPSDDASEGRTAVSQAHSARSKFGPGFLVAAAFIGPGTVVSASNAGAQFGCELLWTILFASLGAIVLQWFAARLGIIYGKGLGEYLRYRLLQSFWFRPVAALVIGALGIGNAAYQTGNLSGAATGLTSILGGDVRWWILLLGITTITILSIGQFQVLQRILIGLVLLLSVSFLLTAALSMPGLNRLATGLLIPKVSMESLTLVMALIGTTVVPYNLFLHASSAAKNWNGIDQATALRQSTLDTTLAIGLGGIVTAAILITASTAFFDQGKPFDSLGAIAEQLRPVLGSFSKYAFAIGLFAAGLTSSITAPLATAYALSGILGWKTETKSLAFRSIAFAVVIAGTLFAILLGHSPKQTILLAQVANGILLPFVACILLWSAHGRGKTLKQVEPLRGKTRASAPALILGWLVVIAVTALAVWRISRIF